MAEYEEIQNLHHGIQGFSTTWIVPEGFCWMLSMSLITLPHEFYVQKWYKWDINREFRTQTFQVVSNHFSNESGKDVSQILFHIYTLLHPNEYFRGFSINING